VIGVSNILGVIIGIVVIIVGLILLVLWWAMFLKGLMAVVPILLVLIGVGALIYFISEIKSKIEIGKEETSTPTSKEQKTE
jgi:threonine/homoserine/homoserine lactone efflux protein